MTNIMDTLYESNFFYIQHDNNSYQDYEIIKSLNYVTQQVLQSRIIIILFSK